jgi:hypothetical protein
MTGTAGALRSRPAPLTTLVTATGAGTLDINPLIAAGYTQVSGIAQAGGCGGGSGRRGAAASIRCGGGPGAPGGTTVFQATLAELLVLFPTGSVPYQVGAGTAGGAAVSVNDTNGNAGGAVGNAQITWFGGSTSAAFAVAFPNNPGSGGTATTGNAGSVSVGNGTHLLTAGQNASTTGGAQAATIRNWAGPGGGITAADAASAGGAGLAGYAGGVAGTGGAVDAAAPTQGTAGSKVGVSAYPGGGAGSITTAAQAGADGLANSGAGGGGGGASLNGNNSGAGGAGGSGYLRYTVS